jgi:pyrroloquinoline-quinone synthase
MIESDLTFQVHQLIDSRSLLKHPFYQAWNVGALPWESLKKYAAQYYHFELAYPTYLSGVHHRCDDRKVRQSLLENLWDEEHGPENHVELWLRFCDALGLRREAVLGASPVPATAKLIETYRHLTAEATPAAGVAALYAFESQVPKIADAKVQGLRNFYGLQDDRSVSFFTVHSTLDQQHAAAEWEIVQNLVNSEGDQQQVLAAVDRSTLALWDFLDGVYC